MDTANIHMDERISASRNISCLYILSGGIKITAFEILYKAKIVL